MAGFAIDLDYAARRADDPDHPIAIVLDDRSQPLVGDAVLSSLLVAAVILIGLYLLSIRSERAFGMGDGKPPDRGRLLLGSGPHDRRPLAGLLAAGIVLAVLSAWPDQPADVYPFGPFLIFGALWGIFITQ